MVPPMNSSRMQRALRSAQHLDSIEVIEVRVDHEAAVERSRRSGQRYVVQVEATTGELPPTGQAAHLELGLPRPGGLEEDPARIGPGYRSSSCPDLQYLDR